MGRIALTIGLVAVGALVAYGFSRSDDDDRLPVSTTPPTIGVIQSPAEVLTTQDVVAVPSGSAPVTADVPVVPSGTADVAFPPVSSNILVP